MRKLCKKCKTRPRRNRKWYCKECEKIAHVEYMARQKACVLKWQKKHAKRLRKRGALAKIKEKQLQKIRDRIAESNIREKELQQSLLTEKLMNDTGFYYSLFNGG